jgi:hypothetical protein
MRVVSAMASQVLTRRIAIRASEPGEDQQMENANKSDSAGQRAMPDADSDRAVCSTSSDGFAGEQAALQCRPFASASAQLESFAILNTGNCRETAATWGD